MNRQSTFLWIGGATRAGTTTLFDAMSDHPDVCPSYIKQTGFFLDASIQDSGLKCLVDSNEPQRYMEFFRERPDAPFLLDATPDYLYSKGTAARLASFSTSMPTKCIFILRQPIDRFASWYSYGKQASLVPSSTTWKEFMHLNSEQRDYSLANIPYLAKQTGRYSEYLTMYYEHFRPENIYIAFLEDFSTNPNAELKAIANFAGMDAAFFDQYKVHKRNANYAIRNASARTLYRRVREVAMKYTYNNGFLFKATSPLRRFASWTYRCANASKPVATPMPKSIADDLRSYYQGESKRIEELTRRTPPWNL